MRKLAILILLATCFLSAPVLAFELDPGKKTHATYVPGELLVKYRPSVHATAKEYYRTQWGITTLRTFRGIGVQHEKLPKG